MARRPVGLAARCYTVPTMFPRKLWVVSLGNTERRVDRSDKTARAGKTILRKCSKSLPSPGDARKQGVLHLLGAQLVSQLLDALLHQLCTVREPSSK